VIRGQLTKKANVYSFGVLMLEIISGRCHTDPRPPLEDQYLLEKGKEQRRNPSILHRFYSHDSSRTSASLSGKYRQPLTKKADVYIWEESSGKVANFVRLKKVLIT
jgi:hypothetical protein